MADITTPIKNAPKLDNSCQRSVWRGGFEECARIIESTHGREVSVITNADKGAGVEGEEGRTVATVGTTFLYD